jgi:hypothetical protein
MQRRERDENEATPEESRAACEVDHGGNIALRHKDREEKGGGVKKTKADY